MIFRQVKGARRRPWWVALLVAMIWLGWKQDQMKVAINHYLSTGDQLGWWGAEPSAAQRAAQWEVVSPASFKWNWVHSASRQEMSALKWGFSAAVLLLFLLLDVAFLKSWGVSHRWPLLMSMYALSLIPMAGLAFSEEGAPWYTLGRACLGFLQSPLPSAMVVALPWFVKREKTGESRRA